MIWRCAGAFLEVYLKFKMAATYQLHIFCAHKNFKVKIMKFYNHNPDDMEMCKWFQGFTEIQNGRNRWTSEFFVGALSQK